MAVFPPIAASPQGPSTITAPVQPVDVEAWTEQVAEPTHAVSITSPNGLRGTPVSLAIDLDQEGKAKSAEDADKTYRPRRKLLRRDSLDRREALLKGKEGSRRRIRWENGPYHQRRR